MTLHSSIKRPATYPAWVFDDSPIPDPNGRGEKAVQFIRNLRHPKARTRAFQLDRWQERIIRRIYGPIDENGDRQISTVFLMVGRGARKTSLQAALTLLHLIGPEKVTAGQVMLAAGDQKQATICYAESVSIIREDKRLSKLVKITEHYKTIKNVATGTKLEAVSSDGERRHGATPDFVCSDEIHVWRGRGLWEAIRTGLAKIPNSLHVITTTAGKGRENIGFETYEQACRIAKGEEDAPHFLPVIFECDPECDWQDEANWHLSNPGLPVYPPLKSLRRSALDARNRPGERESFRQLHLNIWLDGSENPWLDSALYNECGTDPIDFEGRRGERAWLGVDLAATSDLTAIVCALRDEDGGYTVFPFVFAPEAAVRRYDTRGDAPYSVWAADRHLTVTSGNSCDMQAVEAKIRDLCEHFEVQEIAFDSWGAREMQARLMSDGYPIWDFIQGIKSFTGPMKTFERAVLDGKLRHGNHPVLRFCVANVVADMDAAGNIKPNKSKSKLKIDAAVAAIMAVGRAEMGETTTSIYADAAKRPEGLLVF